MLVFGVIAGAAVLAFASSLVLGRSLLGRAVKLRLITSSHGAVAASVRACLRASNRTLAALAALFAVATFVGIGILRSHAANDPVSSSYGLAAWLIGALLVGALSGMVAAHLSAFATTRAAPRIDDSGKLGAADMLRESVQAAGSAAIAMSAILITCFAFLAAATRLAPNEPTPTAHHIVALGAAFALGAVLASIVSHAIGGSFVAASSLSPNSPDLHRDVATHVEAATSWSVDLFASVATVLAAAATLCLAPATAQPLTWVLCPLLAFAFSSLASTVGILVVRTDASEPVASAVDRGLAVTFVLNLAALGGLTHWLFNEVWWRMFLAAASGLLGAMLVLLADRGFALLRARGAQSQSGYGTALTDWGMRMTRATTLAIIAWSASFGGFVAGASTGIEGGTALGMAVSLLGLIAPAPFILTTASVGALMNRSLRTREAQSNAKAERRLSSVVGVARSTRAYAAICAATGAAVAVPALSVESGWFGLKLDLLPMAGMPTALLVSSALFGTLFVFWASGAAMRSAASVLGARYRGAVDLEPATAQPLLASMLQDSVRQALPTLLLTVGIPALVTGFVYVVMPNGAPGTAVTATGAFILGACFGGVALSLSVGGPAVLDGKAKQISDGVDKSVDVEHKWEKNRGDGAVVVGDTLGSPLESLVGPCIHALVKLLATAALALAPFFL